MSFLFLALSVFHFIPMVSAARPWVETPDTGLLTYLGSTVPAVGTLLPLDDIVTIPDFDWAAENYLNSSVYAYYRTGAAGEYSYRASLEAFPSIKLRPRVLRDITNVQNTLNTTILGYNFSSPFFIAPAAKAGWGHPLGETNLVKGAWAGDILYIPSLFASLSIEEIAAAKNPAQITFQQLYIRNGINATTKIIRRAEAVGSKAIVWSVDNSWGPTRSRNARWRPSDPTYDYPPHTWDLYDQLKTLTDLPIIPKGIQTVEDALMAVEHGAPAIYISNHGSRQLDTSQTVMEILLEIYDNAPQVFTQTEVLADSGVRYGSDVLKLLAMGVKAVGLGRPFMFSNIYGTDGVEQLIEMMKAEIIADAGNTGIADVGNITTDIMNLRPLRATGYLLGNQ